MDWLVVIVVACNAVRAGTVKSTVSKEVYTIGSGSVIQVQESNRTWKHRAMALTTKPRVPPMAMPAEAMQELQARDEDARQRKAEEEAQEFDAFVYVGIAKLVGELATHWGLIVQHPRGKTWTWEVYGEGPSETVMAIKSNDGTLVIGGSAPADHAARGPETARSPADYDGLLDVSAWTRKSYRISIASLNAVITWWAVEPRPRGAGGAYDVLNRDAPNCQQFVKWLYKQITKQECELTMDTEWGQAVLASSGVTLADTFGGGSFPGGHEVMLRALERTDLRPFSQSFVTSGLFKWKAKPSAKQRRDYNSFKSPDSVQIVKPDAATPFVYRS